MCYAIKDLCSAVVDHESLNSQSSESRILQQRQAEQELLLRSHPPGGFPGLFREHDVGGYGGRVEDEEEHVLRCIRCHWEIEGDDSECVHCGYVFSVDGDNRSNPNIQLTSDDSIIDTDNEDNINDEENEVTLARNLTKTKIITV